MGKIKPHDLHRLKRVQKAEDDDLELDVTKSRRMKNLQATKQEEAVESEVQKKKDMKNLFIVGGVVLVVFVLFAFIIFVYKPGGTDVMTIDEMHEKNIKGKLKPEQGYIYNGFSFVNFMGVWYTQLSKGSTMYDVSFNYDPRSVEKIPVEGSLTSGFKKEGNRLYVTFDPDGRDLKYVGVANYGLSRSLAWAFGYNMTAACTQNVTRACQKAGIVTCDDTDKAVIYIKEADEAKVVLSDNCVIVQGRGEDIVRAKDRLLLRWYGMVDS
ncbi:hypothetical protein ACFL3V_04575 [Nanoarchaeota archaeon]